MPETDDQRNLRDFRELCAQGDYVAGPGFKVDTFAGGSPAEVAARASFRAELLNHRVKRGDGADGRFSSFADLLQWVFPTMDVMHAKNVETFKATIENSAKLDALTAAVAGLAKALPGGESLDLAKLTQSLTAAVDAGLEKSYAKLLGDVKIPATLSIEINRPDEVETVPTPAIPPAPATPKLVKVTP